VDEALQHGGAEPVHHVDSQLLVTLREEEEEEEEESGGQHATTEDHRLES